MSSSPFSATLAAIRGGELAVDGAKGFQQGRQHQAEPLIVRQARALSQDERIRTRSFPQSLIDHAASGSDVKASPGRTTWTAVPRASPRQESSDGEAESLMVQANAAAAQQLKNDMRDFVLEHPSASLSDWGRESAWASDTGGEVGADGCGVRVLGGVWELLWEEIQDKEQPLLRRLRGGIAAATARDAALAECEELKAHLAAQAEAIRAQKVQTQKMQARLHTVMQAREEEQSRDRQRIDLQALQMEEARLAAAAAKKECEELRSLLAAEQLEVTRLREALECQHNERQKEHHDAMRARSKLRSELKETEARFAKKTAEERAVVIADRKHWQQECEKMCTLLAQAEEKAEFFEARTKCLVRAAHLGGAGVVNVLEAASPSTFPPHLVRPVPDTK